MHSSFLLLVIVAVSFLSVFFSVPHSCAVLTPKTRLSTVCHFQPNSSARNATHRSEKAAQCTCMCTLFTSDTSESDHSRRARGARNQPNVRLSLTLGAPPLPPLRPSRFTFVRSVWSFSTALRLPAVSKAAAASSLSAPDATSFMTTLATPICESPQTRNTHVVLRTRE